MPLKCLFQKDNNPKHSSKQKNAFVLDQQKFMLWNDQPKCAVVHPTGNLVLGHVKPVVSEKNQEAAGLMLQGRLTKCNTDVKML